MGTDVSGFGPDERLRLEQVRLLYEAIPVTVVATLVNGAVLSFFEWQVVDHRLLLSWFGCLFLVTSVRLAITIAFRRARPEAAQIQRWQSRFVAGAILAGIVWGSASLLLFPADAIAYQVFLAFIVGGMSAGSITSLSPLRITVFSFQFLALTPLAIRFFMLGTELAIAMGILFLLFLLLTSANAFKAHQNIVQNIVLRLQSADREQLLRQSEQKLRESEQTYHGLFNSLQESVYILDQEGRFLDVNEGALRMYGYPRERFIGRKPEFLSAPGRNDLEIVSDAVRSAFAGEAQCFEFWGIDASGRQFPNEVRLYPGVYFGQQAVIAIAQDISERRTLESRLLQSQKMEAIGTLVGGIAHDFNNTLAAIMGNLYIARQVIDDRGPLSERLDNIDKLSSHAAAVVRQLLTFARKDTVTISHFSLTAFMQEQAGLSASIIPENIELSFNLCDDELLISGNSTQLQQALINLLNNARDAVTGIPNPAIICRLEPFTADEPFRQRNPGLAATRFARLTVSDNGSGLPEDASLHIFEPFYTTKEVGKGTGLGLAMVYGAVQTHNGAIEVEGQPGKGATFHIYLPLADQADA